MSSCRHVVSVLVPALLLAVAHGSAVRAAEVVRLDLAIGVDGQDISGNAQMGIAGSPLERPLRVQATDDQGRPAAGVLVEFRVVERPDRPQLARQFPQLEPDHVRTSDAGYASTRVMLGLMDGNFHVICSPVSHEGNYVIFSMKAYQKNWLAYVMLGLVGGLAIFLFGIKFGGRGLQKAAGRRLREAVCRLTTNRGLGLLTGIGVTVIIQSSSATTAMLVSFANAGIIVLRQSLGVILGADIGTTLTVQLIAFRIFDYALLIVALGFVLFVARTERYSRFGQIIMGFGLLFFGMSIMSSAVGPAKDHPAFTGFMLGVERNPVLAIVLSAVFTAIIQSSAATIGLVLTFAFQGIITLKSAVPLVLGANVGTCMTALLASLGSTAEGKRIAWAHIFFKIAAVVIVTPFLNQFIRLAGATAPTVTRQIANAHSLFNIGAALIFIPFVTPWARVFRFLVKEEEVSAQMFKPVYLDAKVLDTPSLALGQATRETLRMADITYQVYSRSIDVFLKDDETLRTELIEEDDKIDTLEEAITPYLTVLSQREMSDEEAQRAVALLFIVKNLELIGDIVSKSLMDLALKKITVSPRFLEDALDRIEHYHQEVEKTFQMAIDSMASQNKKLAEEVVDRKSEVNVLERELHKEHLAVLGGSREEVIETSTIYLDVISELKRVNSLASGIAYAVLGKV